MRDVTKTFSVLAILCLVLCSSPAARAQCNFSLPMLQGGDVNTPPGAIINAGATHVNGFFWELGFGDPRDGAGNDGRSLICGYPAFSAEHPLQRWIKGAPDNPQVDWDWGNAGVDNCISGGPGAIEDTVMITYILDSNDHYGIAALKGTNFAGAIPIFNLDNLVTGFGPNGNDVVMGPRIVRPELTNVVPLDEQCLAGDVLPVAAGLNLYFDAGGPYEGVVYVDEMMLENGGTPEACDPRTGCHLDCIQRNSDLCWVGGVDVIASQPGSSFPVCELLDNPCSSDDDCSLGVCSLAPSLVCDPQNVADCFDGILGPCLEDRCVFPSESLVAFGPPIDGGCVTIEGPPSTAAAPEGQGYWHRQCLGVPVRDGGLNAGRQGRGPSAPTEPYFVSDLMPAVALILESTIFEDRGTCYGGMHAGPASDLCERAIKQYTALLLNLESGRLSGVQGVDLSAEGCSSTDVTSLTAELAGLINSADPDNCRLAADCADAVNEGEALVERLVIEAVEAERSSPAEPHPAGAGGADWTEREEPADESVEVAPVPADAVLVAGPATEPRSWRSRGSQEQATVPQEEGQRAIRRHLSVLANPGAPARARDVSVDALLTALSGGYGPKLRLEVVRSLLGELDVAYESLLAGHLRDIRTEGEELGEAKLVARAQALLDSLRSAEE